MYDKGIKHEETESEILRNSIKQFNYKDMKRQRYWYLFDLSVMFWNQCKFNLNIFLKHCSVDCYIQCYGSFPNDS